MSETEKKDLIRLMWGTIKEWKFYSDKALKLMDEYIELGASYGVMGQRDTLRQKEILCELIDACNADEIYLCWDDKYVSKAEAKKYITEYGTNKECDE